MSAASIMSSDMAKRSSMVGVGREGFAWSGTKTVTMKREWPDWSPPPQMLKRRPDLPRHMRGGMDNPLGARAIYLGSSLYHIHGSNEPDTIGAAVSSGCIRMTNQDIVDLSDRVKRARKLSCFNNSVWSEVARRIESPNWSSCRLPGS